MPLVTLMSIEVIMNYGMWNQSELVHPRRNAAMAWARTSQVKQHPTRPWVAYLQMDKSIVQVSPSTAG